MKFKVGDKLYCKTKTQLLDFEKGVTYYINMMDNDGSLYISKYSPKEVSKLTGSSSQHYGTWVINYSTFFYTEKELRKLKLDKLNGGDKI